MATKLSAPDALKEFDIAKYDACKNWDAERWLTALSQRSQLRHFLRSLKGRIAQSPMPTEVLAGEREFFLGVAERCLKNPVEISDNVPWTCAPVVLRDFLLTDIVDAFEVTTKVGVQDCRGIRLRDVAKAIEFRPSVFYVAIDLHAPDLIIQEKFGRWLKKTRYESYIMPKYSGLSLKENVFKKWSSQKLLPYLDLIFWAKLSGHTLTQPDIGRKLFPHVEDTSDRMRSMSKNALKLISKEYTDALARECQTY